ncbi:class I adenylate-forming enzyme family protein [Chelatococcus reniformis]|uniref:ATP-dependent acyl-CoA ligase n=1 Tax=Chelatococcus reniformis TaxID=1494448 RepID=A0A916X9P8_9HYPH|nr:AMP-binding protein [Chelatococcus reniformis]GGC54164.1 ATP-dependent acyl-CoA ligase [Chelatococcus reniformis]
MTATLPGRLIHQAQARPEAPALVFDEETITWADLADLVLRTSAWLRGRGIGPGDHVALLCGNRPAFVVAFYALANLGAVTVSVNTGLVGEGLRHSIVQSGARAVLAEQGLLDQVAADIAPVLRERRLLAFGGEADLFAAARACAPDAIYGGPGSEPLSIIYTSGTTGLPKGVLNCHEAYLASGRWMAASLAITAADRIMVCLPLFHANPQMYALMSALETGCAVVIRPKFSVGSFFDDARRFGCTMFTYVGTLLAMLASRVRERDTDHRLTRCVGGGCPPEVWRAMQDRFGITPYELYGMTEVGGWVTGNSTEAYRFDTCGRVRPDMEVLIVDGHDEPVAPGTPGEIVVRPKKPFTLLLGYWDNADASWQAARNFLFHTGDLGVFDAEGFLSFRGRLKDVIRRGGENIAPAEIEAALLAHPDIDEVAVVGVADPIFGEEIKAVVVARREIAARDVRRFLEGRVARFMLPRYVQFVAALPKTETAKVIRRDLLALPGAIFDLAEARRD